MYKPDQAREKKEQILEKVREYFGQRPEVPLVLVFGSLAKAKFRPDSDVDIAIGAKRAFSPELLFAMNSDLALMLERPVDLVDLGNCGGLVAREALTQGFRIKFDRDLYVRYLNSMLVFVEDYLPLLRTMQDARIRSFTDGS
ncbi:MAG: nucleotidyltransferase domain-containing protein [Spirochaetes bacterium]|nr:nucleotidyltransferase domain-containing protein [Spirochaetota bacterium]